MSEFTLLTLEEIVAPHAVMIALILSLRCCQNKIAAGRWSNYIDQEQALLQNLYSSLLYTMIFMISNSCVEGYNEIEGKPFDIHCV